MKTWSLDLPSCASPEIALLIAAMNDGTREWRENLEDVPDDFAQWRPYPGGTCAGALVLHMASCERWWIDKTVLGTEVDMSDLAVAYDSTFDQYEGIVPDPPAQPWSWYMEQYDSHRARTIASLAEVTDAKGTRGSGERCYTVEWVVAHLLQHDSYHGGQIVMLKTLMDQTGN